MRRLGREMVITLTGKNTYARGAALSKLQSDFTAKYGASAVEEYDGESLTAEVLASALGGVSLFSTHRFVVIRNLSEAKEAAEQFIAKLDQVSEEVTIVVIEPNPDKRTVLYKALKKNTEFHELGELSEQELVAWIVEYASTRDGKIDQRTARLLYEYCGSDQQRLANEIDKLCAYDGTITKETIELLVEKNPRDTIFELLELAMGGRTKQAIATLTALEKSHSDPFQIASMLIWQAHIMAVVQTAGSVSDGEVAKTHKINPYVVSKTKRLAGGMGRQKLSSILDTAAQLDITLKTNAHDPWRALEHTVLAL